MTDDRKRGASDMYLDPSAAADLAAKRMAETPQVTLKIMCPAKRAGSVIGKGGEVIKQIRQLSGAYVKVQEADQNGDRLVSISSDEAQGAPLCPAQDALLRILARIVEVHMPDGSYQAPVEAEAKLLVARTFIGHILGKGGSRVSEIRLHSAARIKVHKSEDLPDPAANAQIEELIQVSGGYENVKTALLLITAHIREAIARKKNVDISLVATAAPLLPPMPPLISMEPMQPEPQILPPIGGDMIAMEFRLLLPDARVGGLIGRGGENVKAVRAESGAQLRIMEAVPGCYERVVVMTSADSISDTWCAAADALLRCAHIALADWNPPNGTHALQLLVPAHQTRMVLNPEAIRQVYLDTSAHLNVIFQIPACARHDDAVVQVSGIADCVMAGLRAIAGLLRADVIGMQIASSGGGYTAPPSSSYPAPSTTPKAVIPPPIAITKPKGVAPFAPLPGSIAGQFTMRMTVQSESVGGIVGKGGSNINTIRKVSGAKVKLHDGSSPSGERDVELTGSLEQIQSAHAIIALVVSTGVMPAHVESMGPLSMGSTMAVSGGSLPSGSDGHRQSGYA